VIGDPRPGGPRHRRRPSPGVLLGRWLGLLGVLGVIVVGAVFAGRAAVGSTHSGRTATAGSRAGTPSGSGGRTSATRSTASTIPPTPSTVAPAPVTISVVGDTELGNTPQLPPNPSTYLDPVRGALTAAVVFGNLEGTLTDSTGSKCGSGSTDCFAFRTPPAYAQYLRNDGFTVLNSANNHAHDFGAQGVIDTSSALQTAGIVQAGLPGQIGVIHAGTTSVAFVDFAPYTTANNLLDLATARTLIEQAKSKADIVVAYMHAGAEGSQADHVSGSEESYVGEDRGNPKAFAHAAIDDGADMVVASGPHVLRGMEFYRGHLVAYSLGNFASYHNFGVGGDLSLSGILKVTLDGRGRFVSGTFVSVTLGDDGQPSLDPSGAAARFVAQLSTADFGAAAATLSATGVISPPKRRRIGNRPVSTPRRDQVSQAQPPARRPSRHSRDGDWVRGARRTRRSATRSATRRQKSGRCRCRSRRAEHQAGASSR
jgi:hypothetical protein